ncbi:hypothetical protein ACHWQZ_G010875 [Mnemiopsis leidyi]
MKADKNFPVPTGTVLSLSCNDGFELTGDNTVTCTQNTEFQVSVEPTCAPICTGLKTEWTSTIETTTVFPVLPGTVVTVTCSNSDAVNVGSSEVTCTKETDYTFSIEPSCSTPGLLIHALKTSTCYCYSLGNPVHNNFFDSKYDFFILTNEESWSRFRNKATL